MDLSVELAKNPHLAVLPPVHLLALAAACTTTHHGAGEVLFKEGDHADALYFLLRGAITITGARIGRHRRLATLTAPALFGTMALIERGPRSATCTTAAPCEIASIPTQAVALLLNQSGPIAYAFQRALAAQMACDLRAGDAYLRQLLQRGA